MASSSATRKTSAAAGDMGSPLSEEKKVEMDTPIRWSPKSKKLDLETPDTTNTSDGTMQPSARSSSAPDTTENTPSTLSFDTDVCLDSLRKCRERRGNSNPGHSAPQISSQELDIFADPNYQEMDIFSMSTSAGKKPKGKNTPRSSRVESSTKSTPRSSTRCSKRKSFEMEEACSTGASEKENGVASTSRSSLKRRKTSLKTPGRQRDDDNKDMVDALPPPEINRSISEKLSKASKKAPSREKGQARRTSRTEYSSPDRVEPPPSPVTVEKRQPAGRKEGKKEARPDGIKPISAIRSSSLSIALTGLDGDDRDLIGTMVQALGRKRGSMKTRLVENPDPSAVASHVVVDENCSRRTLRALFAMCRGAWVLSPSWVFTSVDQGTWVSEWDHVAKRFSHGNEQKRKCDPLKSADDAAASSSQALSCSQPLTGESVIIGPNLDPPVAVLRKLANAAGGKVVRIPAKATLCIVGSSEEGREWVLRHKAALQKILDSSRVVRPKYLFDAIEFNNPGSEAIFSAVDFK